MREFDSQNNNVPADENTNHETTNDKRNGFVKLLLEQFDIFIAVFALIVVVTSCIGRVCTVSGDSMQNTLIDKDPLIVSNLFYTPQRGDIIVFHQTGSKPTDYNEPIVKRVIGIAGDTVKIEHKKDTMTVTVTDKFGNTTVLEEDYIRYDYATYKDSETYVSEGTVFVMGDNRSHSADSRSATIGLVDTRRILGRVIFRLGGSSFGVVD